MRHKVFIFYGLLIFSFPTYGQNSFQENLDACNLDNSEACVRAANAYRNGFAGTLDFDKANELYNKACDLNNSAGCFNLGVIYNSGSGVKKDQLKAKEFYRKACDIGSEKACSAYNKIK